MNFIDFNLNESILKAIRDVGYHQPTNVQKEVIPAILAGKDLVVKAKTGSGKTSAFAIPLLEKISTEKAKPKVLVVTPTRELAEQVFTEFTKLGRYNTIKSMAVYGKKPIQSQINTLKDGVHVVIGTPGRINDLILRHALNLDFIEYLVLDEADELLNRGFFDDITDIMKEMIHPHQTLLFSATMPEEIQVLCQTYIRDPFWVEIIEDLPKIKEINYLVESKWKFLRFREILTTINPFTCLIFCNTRSNVDDLYNRMRQVGIKPLRIHGGMKQRDRLKTIKSFREGNVQCLIATDLVARGIHIDSLDLVINYDIPQIAENYIHRIGRTGRVGEDGIAVSLFTSADELYKLDLEKYLGNDIIFTEFDHSSLDKSDIHLSNKEKLLIKFQE